MHTITTFLLVVIGRATNAFRELNLKFKNLFCQFINYDECKVEDFN